MNPALLLALAGLLQLAPRNIAGAALDGHKIYTWGRELLEWNSESEPPRLVARSTSNFGEGGCMDGDSIVLQDAGLVRIRIADGRRTVLDEDAQMHDCMAATLFGKHGVLAVHRYAQIRFYYGGGMQEVYSFYTASRQGGLLRTDIDSDGRQDLLCGNYWLRSPERFDLPWRLFAINARHETPESANFRLAWLGRDLIAAQGHMAPGIVYRYSRGADPKQLWAETRVAELRNPQAVAGTSAGVVIGENSGPGSGVFLLRSDGSLDRIATTDGVHTALVEGDRVALVGAERITWIALGK